MGTFQEVTTSTMERGSSTLRGVDTLRSLQSSRASTWATHAPQLTFGMRANEIPATPNEPKEQRNVPVLPFEVVLLLAETRSGQGGRGFAQVADEVVAEVEGERVLVGQEPPGGTAGGGRGGRGRWTVNVSAYVETKPDRSDKSR